MAFKDARQCKAKSKRSGERCRNPAVVGFEVCRMHGANKPKRGVSPGRAPGSAKPEGSGGPAWRNWNARKHGIFSGRLTPEEKELAATIQAEFEKDLGGADKLSAADRMLLSFLAANAAKLTSGSELGAPPKALRTLFHVERAILRELKLTRASRGRQPIPGSSPAEWFAMLLRKIQASESANEDARGPGRPPGSPKPEGSGGPAWGNTNALKHGAYSSRLTPEEATRADALMAEYLEDVPHPTATDRQGLERLAVIEAKWNTAVESGAPPEALDKLSRMLHLELRALQVTRAARGPAALKGTTPAEVFADLLARVRQSELEKQRQASSDPEADANPRQDE
jgi:hypothetical protein